MTPFLVCDASVGEQRSHWVDLWERWPEQEPTGHPGYFETVARPGEFPLCATYDLGDGGVLYPFLIRQVGAAAVGGTPTHWDITGPLIGYTGPFGWNVEEAVAARFWADFDSWVAERRVVSSFVRLSLFAENLRFPGRTRVVQPNVVRTLQITDEALWADVERKVRRNVNRARSEGVVVDADPACHQLELFGTIYTATMQRRQAASSFLFDTAFFERLVGQLRSSVQLYFARVGTDAVAAELVLTSTHHAYSLLGGTLASAFHLRPNDLLKYEIIRSLRDQGFTHFVLGGGPQPRDGIFRYKLSFAPRGVVDFRVGEQIHDAAAYEKLVEQRVLEAAAAGQRWEPDPNFFPAYRSA